MRKYLLPIALAILSCLLDTVPCKAQHIHGALDVHNVWTAEQDFKNFGGGFLFANKWPGTGNGDCGDQINQAYASLPSTGGVIIQPVSCSFTTPIVFGTVGKQAILEGVGDSTTVLTFTPTTGTAVTLNWGNGTGTSILEMSHGIRDLSLTGPGNSTSAIGLLIGGSNGAQGFSIRDFKIQSFGVNVKLGSQTWIGQFNHGMIRDGGTNVLFPSGLTNSGENIEFDHVVFADAPSPHTNSVWIQGGGQEIVFVACSFDQAQLRIGNGGTSAAQVGLIRPHFENPNFATGVDYAYVVVDNNNGNYLTMDSPYLLQDRTTGGAYATFMTLQGGQISMSKVGMFTPAGITLTHFANLSNAVNVRMDGFNDLSGLTGALYGGSTTGWIQSFPGTNTASITGFNNIIGPGNLLGGSLLDVAGNIRTTGGQFVSTVTTGTAPLIVDSTTLVNNLTAHPSLVGNTGTNMDNAHGFAYTFDLSGGTLTVTLSGGAVYTNSSSYHCTGADTSAANPFQIVKTSGTSITVNGTGTDNIDVICWGN